MDKKVLLTKEWASLIYLLGFALSIFQILIIWVILKLIKNKTNIQTNKLQLSKECNNEIKQHVTS